MPIKNIIFDLGGVILNINYQLTIDAFHRLGATHFVRDFTHYPEHAFFNKYEIGKISCAEFREHLRASLCLNVSDQELDKAWNAMLLDLPRERIDFLQQVRQQYRTFLFSNTNAIHLNAVTNICWRQHQINSIDNLFEKAYYSHLLGMRKPNADGFLTILAENNLAPEETVFVDDLYANIVGAQQVNLHTIHLANPDLLIALPKQLAKLG